MAVSGHIKEAETRHRGSSIDAGANLVVIAGTEQDGNLKLSGSTLNAKDKLTASGTNVLIESAVDSQDVDMYLRKKRGFTKTIEHTESTVGGQLAAGKDLTVVARGSAGSDGHPVPGSGDLTLTGAQLASETGAITLVAHNDVTLAEQQLDYSRYDESFYKKKGLVSSKSSHTISDVHATQSIGSTLSGESIVIGAGHDIATRAATLVATQDLTLSAGNDISIGTAQDTLQSTYHHQEKKSGVFGGGGSITIGKRELQQDNSAQSVTHVGSQVASLEGNVALIAGNAYQQTASQVLAVEGDIDIHSKQVDIGAALDMHANHQATRFKQSGITVSVSNPLISGVQSVSQVAKAADDTDDARMKALAVATAALAVKDTVTALAQDPASLGGIKLSISAGSSKSESTSTQQAATVVGSKVTAAGDVNITATGAGQDSNLTVTASDIAAGRNVSLIADNRIDLQAGRSTLVEHSTNKSSSASIGIGIGIGGSQNGISLEAAASKARGQADGQDIVHTHTHVQAGNVASLDSGGDTTLQGATASGKAVQVQVGGDLQVASVQDASQYKSKQSSSGASVSLCIPPACYGTSTVSGSIGKSKVDGDYLSVVEQSGIKAGDDGFQVQVQGHTELTGAVIASSQAAIDAGKNSLATGSLSATDLVNHDKYEAKGYSISGSIGTKLGDQDSEQARATMSQKDKAAADATPTPRPGLGVGLGSAEGSQSSTTHSGISGGLTVIRDEAQQQATGQDSQTVLASLNRDVTSESETANALAKAWNADKLQKEVQAQVAITQAFSQAATKAVGDYADKKLKEAEAKREQAKAEVDPAKRDALLKSADELQETWKGNGAGRVALHIAVGALAGGTDGAVGAGATAIATPAIAEQIKQLDAPEEVKDALIAVAGTTIGAIAGGEAGAAAGSTQVVNNYLNHKQWEEYAQERSQCKGKQCDEVDAKYRKISREQDIQLAQCSQTGNCAQLIKEVKDGADAMLDLIRDGQLPQHLAGGSDLQNMGQRLAASPKLRADVTHAIEVTQYCEANPAQCDRKALEHAMLVVAPVLGGGAVALMIRSAPAVAAAAKMTVETCLANWLLCGNRAAIAVSEISAGDALGGATLATTAASVATKGGKVVVDVVEEVAAAKAVVGAKGAIAHPEGLAYRVDFPDHLFGPDGFTRSGQLSGTHNLSNAKAVLDSVGATYTLNPTSTPGIPELSYNYINPVNGKTIAASKTVYDPSIYSDQVILDLSQKAGKIGFESLFNVFSITAQGMQAR